MILLAAQRRSLLSNEENVDDRGTHALVGARALLTLAGGGDEAGVFEHIDAYADNSALISSFLLALSASAEETSDRAEVARRIWPNIITHVLDLDGSGHTLFHEEHYGDVALAALMPNAASEISYLFREVEDQPIAWWEPLAWRSEIEKWLRIAAGNGLCVDHLIGCLGALTTEEQARTGVTWVETLVLADPPRVARRSYLVQKWLIEIRSAAVDVSVSDEWQRVVDALVVAGVRGLAPYSE